MLASSTLCIKYNKATKPWKIWMPPATNANVNVRPCEVSCFSLGIVHDGYSMPDCIGPVWLKPASVIPQASGISIGRAAGSPLHYLLFLAICSGFEVKNTLYWKRVPPRGDLLGTERNLWTSESSLLNQFSDLCCLCSTYCFAVGISVSWQC